ncbi:hypothetical protein KUTeg_001146 [Tegillarca granosa]|uniref:Uncharacterized protein n=1 Tax=Tegillarca granosa TaxID=220873 RepID=A0ABQ9FVL4_TEGGR|nr:hypothetical protein KUTeg_001146 [Tegillarca granosa]
MDQKVCEASKRLNELQHQRNQREDRLHELQECRMYPAKLGNLEEIVSDAKDELDILCQMNEKAIKSSEEARKDLHTMEREMYQSKRSRDQQLNETRKEVERRKEPSDRAEKRVHSKGARLLLQKADRQEKILTLEEGFETIKSAINVSDIEDVVFRVANQGNTHERLVKQEKEKMRAKEKLLNEKNKLQTVGRKLVEAMQDYMKTEEKQRDHNVKEMLKNEKLLLDLQSGITTLNEKLSNVKLKPPYHNYTKGDPVDDLLVCARKLEMLLSETAIRKYLEGTSHRVDHNKLHTYLEGKLPPENIRIRIDTDDGSDEDEFHFDHDQDNDGLMSRDDIKKLGTDLMNSKLKTKKKKGRKARAN